MNQGHEKDFPDELVGLIMCTYYGGRCEITQRKKPVETTVLDFTSMYPTMMIVMDLWQYIIAESIETEDATADVKQMFAEKLDIQYLLDRNRWKDFVVMVKIIPHMDIFPVRMNYKPDDSALTVGLNYLSTEFPMWYTLPDVIGSYLLTGKVPEIIEAIRFVPKGLQESLKSTQILGVPIDPRKDNPVKVFVEKKERLRKLAEDLGEDHPDFKHMKDRQRALKILVNAFSYGIFLELNPEESRSDFKVWGEKDFTVHQAYFEKPGRFFHPLIATMITAAARLFLTMAEVKLKELDQKHFYMDTDSVFVPPVVTDEIIDFFDPLNPYDENIPLIKKEWDKVMFYGISSKRYVLFHMTDGEVSLAGTGENRSYMLFGLGHLTNPFSDDTDEWHAEFWMDILKYNYGKISEEDIFYKYGRRYAISEFTISTPYIMHYFDAINKGKPWKEQIKPYNFALTGFPTIVEGNKPVKPLAPFTKQYQKIVHEPFVDLYTGKINSGMKYFKPLNRIFWDYAKHPEYKFKGIIGSLERKEISADGVFYIGKEINKLDEQVLEGKNPQLFFDDKEKKRIIDRILELPQSVAERIGVDRGTFVRIKRRIKENRAAFKFDTKAVQRLVQYLLLH